MRGFAPTIDPIAQQLRDREGEGERGGGGREVEEGSMAWFLMESSLARLWRAMVSIAARRQRRVFRLWYR